MTDGIIHIFMLPHYTITDRNGKVWRFEYHSYMGPTTLTKSGEQMERQPGQRSPFWEAFNAWADQGNRLDDNKALWDPEPVLTEDDKIHWWNDEHVLGVCASNLTHNLRRILTPKTNPHARDRLIDELEDYLTKDQVDTLLDICREYMKRSGKLD